MDVADPPPAPPCREGSDMTGKQKKRQDNIVRSFLVIVMVLLWVIIAVLLRSVLADYYCGLL
jgi:hypothetical protein